MNQNLALEVLASVMQWDDDHAREEYRWLRLMSRLKFDGYHDFLAGVRFIESLSDWLQQFAKGKERTAAYEFVRRHLLFISTAEMQHLVNLAYPETIQPHLMKSVAEDFSVPPYLLWSRSEGIELYRRRLRQTLFLGLSDGAHMDVFRRANVGIISNEQVVGSIQFDDDKWDDLLESLRNELQDGSARFKCVFLIDDFTGSGTSLLREKDGNWKGKLVRFWQNIEAVDRIHTHFVSDWKVYVHHYLASYQASQDIPQCEERARKSRGSTLWFPHMLFTFGMILPEDFPVSEDTHQDFMGLVEHYYDASLETKHTREGGTPNVKRGFCGCSLPLVLEHNTPNNSLALIWADTEGKEGAAMRPLFRRRQRHQ